MCDSLDNSDPDKDLYAELDELLCEYVDGAMDPAVRRVFEEYVRANPDLAAHIDDLRRTRALLCRYRCRIHAPFGFSRKLHREVTDEMMRAQAPMFSTTSHRLRQATSLTSMVVAMMMVGLVSGSLLVEEESSHASHPPKSSNTILDDAPVRSLDRLPVHPSVRQSGFAAFSWSASPVETSVTADTQMVRTLEFERLRGAGFVSP